MYYSNLVKLASNISFNAHKNDLDKGGYPYIYHPAFLASQMDDEITTCVAFLHDVIEDHGDEYTFEYLESLGFYKEIIDALKLLTHKKEIPYEDYIKKIKTNKYATKVKIADLKHNLDTRRTNGKKAPKYETYIKYLKFLEDLHETEKTN
jgi:(p)ppGpp synthase/HD superfamily hydrolase